MIRAILFAYGIFLLSLGCDTGTTTTEVPPPSPPGHVNDAKDGSGLYRVEYLVTGSAETVSLTYENASGNVSQFCCPHLPDRRRLSFAPGAFVYISAQNQGRTGSVTSTINLIRDDQTKQRFSTSTSSGPFVIATASGSLPQ